MVRGVVTCHVRVLLVYIGEDVIFGVVIFCGRRAALTGFPRLRLAFLLAAFHQVFHRVFGVG